MSLIEYSVFTQNLTTISMHNYDREEFKVRELQEPESWDAGLIYYDITLQRDIGYKGVPKVQVDHQSRCAVLHFYRTFFAILPFKHDSSIGAGMEEDEETRLVFCEWRKDLQMLWLLLVESIHFFLVMWSRKSRNQFETFLILNFYMVTWNQLLQSCMNQSRLLLDD